MKIYEVSLDMGYDGSYTLLVTESRQKADERTAKEIEDLGYNDGVEIVTWLNGAKYDTIRYEENDKVIFL